MLKAILLILLALWLIGAIASLVDHARWRVGLITYPEQWAMILAINLFAWPWQLYDTYRRPWTEDPPGP